MNQLDFARQLRQQMTDAERLLWRHLRGRQLAGAKFRRQQPVGPYVADFIHFESRLIIEADGGQHNDAPRDATRDAWLAAQGYRVLRFWNHDILTNIESVMTAVLLALKEARGSDVVSEKDG